MLRKLLLDYLKIYKNTKVILVNLPYLGTDKFFPKSVTAELKGLAILMIILGHIGYLGF